MIGDATPSLAANASRVLLISSAVKPFAVDVAHRDGATRALEQEQQLEWLARSGGYRRIVLCDSSGHDFGALAQRMPAGIELELLSFTLPHRQALVYKAYGEQQIYRHALEHSRLLREAKVITKLTGRYRLASACPLFTADTRPFVFSYNRVAGNDRCLLTNLFRLSRPDFERFAASTIAPDDPLPLEFHLRPCLDMSRLHPHRAPLPLFAGTSGTGGGSLGTDPRYRVKRWLSFLLSYAYVGEAV